MSAADRPSPKALPDVKRLVETLGHVPLEMHPTQILDLLWLLIEIQKINPVKSEGVQRKKVSPGKQPGKDEKKEDRDSRSSEPLVDVRQATQEVSSEAGGVAGVPVELPSAPALRHQLALARALRPLLRQVVFDRLYRLNESATVEQIVEQDLWEPVFSTGLEPWLELELVVDNYASMRLWEATLKGLQKVLGHYGLFRDLRVWGWCTDRRDRHFGQLERDLELWGPVNRSQRFYPASRLKGYGGNRVILVVSDCLSSGWQDGSLVSILRQWGESCRISLLQMLPDRLWSRTALAAQQQVWLKSPSPLLLNGSLLTKSPSRWEPDDHAMALRIPVFTLELEQIQVWSRWLMGQARSWRVGYGFESLVAVEDDPSGALSMESRSPESVSEEPQSQPTATERAMAQVYQFYRDASPLAWRLAGLLAAAPLVTMPIVDIIRAKQLPQSQQVHVAEVFLRLLRPTRPIAPEQRSAEVVYEFLDLNINQELLKTAGRRDVDLVLRETFKVISDFIQREMNVRLDSFRGLLTLVDQGTPEQQASLRRIAQISILALQRLGGKPALLAAELQRAWQGTGDRPLPERQERGETVWLTVLHSFEFETAQVRVQQGRGKKSSQIQIQRQQGQGLCLLETLAPGVVLEMVEIEGGTFQMGAASGEERASSDEYPQHSVTVGRFYLSRYPITQAQWRAVMGNNPAERYGAKFVNPQKPVVGVSWHDAVNFCQELERRTNRPYRLPSEAEWAYACRAGTTTAFHFGETITPDLANYNGNYVYGAGEKGVYRQETTVVGSFPANGLGLHDMHGNVYDWCADHWHENYEGAPDDGSAWVLGGDSSRRVLRGGSWSNSPARCRCAYRYRSIPGNSNDVIGFRVGCSPSRT